jgi:hypothetical protein
MLRPCSLSIASVLFADKYIGPPLACGLPFQGMGLHANPEIVLASSGGFIVGHLPGVSH